MVQHIVHDVFLSTRLSRIQRVMVQRYGSMESQFCRAMKPFEGRPVDLAILGNDLTVAPASWRDYVLSHPEWRPQCHGLVHRRYDWVDDGTIRDELLRTVHLIEDVFGQSPTLFIPPYYKGDERTKAIAASLGMKHMRRTARVMRYYVKQRKVPGRADWHYWYWPDVVAAWWILRRAG